MRLQDILLWSNTTGSFVPELEAKFASTVGFNEKKLCIIYSGA